MVAISRKDFEDGNFKSFSGATMKILEFLRNDKDNAHTSKDIALAVGTSQVNASIALRKLTKSGLIESKRPYFIITDTKSKKKKKEEDSAEESSDEEE
jgi:DNA-binding MarR family transcriptional regulator